MKLLIPGCLLLSALSAQASETLMPAIVGGTDLTTSPSWMVSLQLAESSGNTTYYYHTCGATLIDPQWVMTAAHCVQDRQPSDFNLVLGKATINYTTKGLSIDQIVIHPDWVVMSESLRTQLSQFKGDIALLHLTQVQTATPVNLASASEQSSLSQGQLMTAIGWGLTNAAASGSVPTQLQTIQLPYQGQGNTSVLPDHIYAGGVLGQGACLGDSGGPLYLGNIQYGLTSFVQVGATTCASVNDPAGYTSASYYSDWIQTNIQSLAYTTSTTVTATPGQSVTGAFTIRNPGALTWTLGFSSPSNAALSGTCTTLSNNQLGPQDSCVLDVGYTGSSTIGDSSQITVNATFTNSASTTTGTLTLYGSTVSSSSNNTSSSTSTSSSGGGGGAIGLFPLLGLLGLGWCRRLIRSS